MDNADFVIVFTYILQDILSEMYEVSDFDDDEPVIIFANVLGMIEDLNGIECINICECDIREDITTTVLIADGEVKKTHRFEACP